MNGSRPLLFEQFAESDLGNCFVTFLDRAEERVCVCCVERKNEREVCFLKPRQWGKVVEMVRAE